MYKIMIFQLNIDFQMSRIVVWFLFIIYHVNTIYFLQFSSYLLSTIAKRELCGNAGRDIPPFTQSLNLFLILRGYVKKMN